jgi:hypothetical protein
MQTYVPTYTHANTYTNTHAFLYAKHFADKIKKRKILKILETTCVTNECDMSVSPPETRVYFALYYVTVLVFKRVTITFLS